MRSKLPIAFVLGCLVTCLGAQACGQLIVAHRGASADAPENTIAAFELAWEQEADAIEGDFYLTADKQIVCTHDKTTKRTSGVERIVADASLAELRQLDVGRWKDERFAGERIPTLREVLNTVPDGKTIYIEIKCGQEILPQLQEELQAHVDPRVRIVVICFQSDVIAAMKTSMPEADAYWLVEFKQDEDVGPWHPTIESVVATAVRIGADGVGVKANAPALDPQFVTRCDQAGLSLHAWTVDDPDVALRLIDLGYQSITTNRPRFLREAASGRLQPVAPRERSSSETVKAQ